MNKRTLFIGAGCLLAGYLLRGWLAPAPTSAPPVVQPPNTGRVEVAVAWLRPAQPDDRLEVYPLMPDPYGWYDGLVVHNPTNRTLRKRAQLVFYHGRQVLGVRLDRVVTIPPNRTVELRYDSFGRQVTPTHAVLMLETAR